MVDPLSYYFYSSQCSMSGVTKAVVCAILSIEYCVGVSLNIHSVYRMVNIKDHLWLIQKCSPYRGSSRFVSLSLSGPLP